MTTQQFNNHCSIVHKTHNNPKSIDNNPRNIGVAICITLGINDPAICTILIKGLVSKSTYVQFVVLIVVRTLNSAQCRDVRTTHWIDQTIMLPLAFCVEIIACINVIRPNKCWIYRGEIKKGHFSQTFIRLSTSLRPSASVDNDSTICMILHIILNLVQ